MMSFRGIAVVALAFCLAPASAFMAVRPGIARKSTSLNLVGLTGTIAAAATVQTFAHNFCTLQEDWVADLIDEELYREHNKKGKLLIQRLYGGDKVWTQLSSIYRQERGN